MKKTILVTGIFVLCSASFAFADTVTFSRNLSVGASGSDVISLQDFLETGGFLKMPQGVAKGYFGQLTRKALIAYQTSVRISATGYFGPITRGRLNGKEGNSTPSITVYSPSGGSLNRGSIEQITWLNAQAGSVDIYLKAPLPPPLPSSGSVVFSNPGSLIVQNVSGTAYSWIVGQTTAGDISFGDYKIVVCKAGTTLCGESDLYIHIIPPPVQVRYPNGGENLQQGLQATITWSGGKNVSDKYEIFLIPQQCTGPQCWKLISAAPTSGSGSYAWSVGTVAVVGTVSGGNYYVRVCYAGSGYCDSSDAPFTITSATQ